MLNVRQAVVVGAATHALPDVVDSLVRATWATLDADARMLAARRLAERGGEVDKTLLYCLRTMKSAEQVKLIGHCNTFSAAAEKTLAATKSVSVLRTLAKRRTTHPETLVALVACSDETTRALARSNPSLPLASKIALATGGSGSPGATSTTNRQALISTWCRQDADFAEWYLTGMLTVSALTCGGPRWKQVDVFEALPDVVDERFAPVLTAAVASIDAAGPTSAGALRRSIHGWVYRERRLVRRGSPAAIEAFVAACAADEALGSFLTTTCGATAVAAGYPHARRGTWRWTHAASAAAALTVARTCCPGGILHCAVLASRFVADETLRAELAAAVATADVATLEALALNPNLTDDQAATLIDVLPTASLWRLHRAPLDTETRVALLRRCPELVELILDHLTIDPGSGVPAARNWIEAWLTRDVLEGFIADRGEMGEELASRRRAVSTWVSAYLARHPDGVAYVVEHARTGDYAVAQMVDALGAAFSASCRHSDEAQQVAKLLDIYDDRVSETWITAARMARKR